MFRGSGLELLDALEWKGIAFTRLPMASHVLGDPILDQNFLSCMAKPQKRTFRSPTIEKHEGSRSPKQPESSMKKAAADPSPGPRNILDLKDLFWDREPSLPILQSATVGAVSDWPALGMKGACVWDMASSSGHGMQGFLEHL